jgi:hypothetical protein
MDDETIRRAILESLSQRGPDKSICPSEPARALASAGAGDEAADWRRLMPDIRRVAAILAAEGRLVATRKGAVVDAESPGGPIRLRATRG